MFSGRPPTRLPVNLTAAQSDIQGRIVSRSVDFLAHLSLAQTRRWEQFLPGWVAGVSRPDGPKLSDLRADMVDNLRVLLVAILRRASRMRFVASWRVLPPCFLRLLRAWRVPKVSPPATGPSACSMSEISFAVANLGCALAFSGEARFWQEGFGQAARGLARTTGFTGSLLRRGTEHLLALSCTWRPPTNAQSMCPNGMPSVGSTS